MRHHTLMHNVDHLAREHFDGSTTGVRLGPERSRVDFRLSGSDRQQLPTLEANVNALIRRDLPVTASVVDADELIRRPELVRTANVLPPVAGGQVRVVEIRGFDVQACGGPTFTPPRRWGPPGRPDPKTRVGKTSGSTGCSTRRPKRKGALPAGVRAPAQPDRSGRLRRRSRRQKPATKFQPGTRSM